MSVARAELPAMVEEWRLLVCPEWRVVILDKPPPDRGDDDFWAISECADDYPRISVFFTDDCLERAREHVEVTVVHELLHALTRPNRQIVNRLYEHLAPGLVSEIRHRQSHEEEQIVDRLSRLLVALRRDAAHVGPATVKGPVV